MPSKRHNPPPIADAAIEAGMQAQWDSTEDAYEQLNRLRDWVNVHVPDVELYLEDVWNDHVPGETHFEYILRSLRTLNETPPLGYDVYLNHQDAKGVWHLGEYQHTVKNIDSPAPLLEFIQANRA